jgi:hypothetical protein
MSGAAYPNEYRMIRSGVTRSDGFVVSDVGGMASCLNLMEFVRRVERWSTSDASVPPFGR